MRPYDFAEQFCMFFCTYCYEIRTILAIIVILQTVLLSLRQFLHLTPCRGGWQSARYWLFTRICCTKKPLFINNSGPVALKIRSSLFSFMQLILYSINKSLIRRLNNIVGNSDSAPGAIFIP